MNIHAQDNEQMTDVPEMTTPDMEQITDVPEMDAGPTDEQIDEAMSHIDPNNIQLTEEELDGVLSEELAGMASSMQELVTSSYYSSHGEKTLTDTQLDAIHHVIKKSHDEIAGICNLATVDQMQGLMGSLNKAIRTMPPGMSLLAGLSPDSNIVTGADEIVDVTHRGVAYTLLYTYMRSAEDDMLVNVAISYANEPTSPYTVVGVNLSHRQVAEKPVNKGTGPLGSTSFDIAMAGADLIRAMSPEDRMLAYGKAYLRRRTFNKLMVLLDVDGKDSEAVAKAIPSLLVDRAIESGLWPTDLTAKAMGL